MILILILLDVSAAFDTVYHPTLINRVSNRFGIQDQALQWVRSYLSNCKQFVVIEGTRAEELDFNCNVPQGSVLGPGFFCDYSTPVGNIFRKHGIPFHLYTDDIQVYVTFHPSEEKEMLETLGKCISEVKGWMSRNYLKVNDSKNDFIILGKQSNLNNCLCHTLPLEMMKFHVPKLSKTLVLHLMQICH